MPVTVAEGGNVGAFFLLCRQMERQHEPADTAAFSTMERQMAAQGFRNPEILRAPGYDLAVYPKQNSDKARLVEFGNGDFCASTGTLMYQGLAGGKALERYHRDFQPSQPPSERLYGAFCLLLRKQGTLYLLIDRLGVYKVFRNPQGTVWSSSLLAVAATLDAPRIRQQAVYEFVFQGATYGNETVFEDVGIADCDYLYRFDPLPEAIERRDRLVQPQTSTATVGELLEESLTALRSYYADIAACYGDRVDTALSGGYDSRLTLALLKEQGVTPGVHVYGKASDADVRIAQAIDAGEKLGLKHIDKSTFPEPSLEAFPAVVEQNHFRFDGCPTDGIFNNGSDLATRRQRCEGGALMLNGGGGEVFRNFFYLPDRPCSVRQLLWTFYSQFDPAMTSARFDEEAYHRRLGEKISSAIGASSTRLSRAEVELVYPLFRCRYWMGKNNSINNRLGDALTPFIDYPIVRRAVTVPVPLKNHGRFEAALIRTVSPALAAYPSDYGHDFVAGPGFRHWLSDQLTLRRPPWLRHYLYRIKARRLPLQRPAMLADERLASVMDADFPYLSKWFRVKDNPDNAQYNRICTLEYLFQKTSARLP